MSMRSFDASPIRLEVLDAAGRIVGRARLETSEPEIRLWTWDGLTDGGSVAPAGYYRVRAFDGNGGTSRSLVRLGGTC